MTEITDAETAEVLWASDEQGQAAVKAAWEKARQLGLDVRLNDTPGVAMADISAIVYAAYLAAGWDGEPDGEDDHGCQHSWTILDAQEVPPVIAFIAKPTPRTAILTRCTNCGEPASRILDGTWTMETFTVGTGS